MDISFLVYYLTIQYEQKHDFWKKLKKSKLMLLLIQKKELLSYNKNPFNQSELINI